MTKVTYLGVTDMRHSGNPTRTEYMFYSQKPTEVKPEDAKHYAEKETKGGPWHVEMGVIEKANAIITEVTEEIKKEKPRRFGGKK